MVTGPNEGTGRCRVLLAKLGMDAHWRGVMVVARLLRAAGHEVIYLGHATPEQIAAIARDEDVDVVGLSSLSGNHLGEVERVRAALRDAAIDDRVAVVVGGAIASSDAAILLAEGVHAVFGPGTAGAEILNCLGEIGQQAKRA